MRSEYLQTLVELISKGSFSKAAESLCITQSAVSRRIHFLEEQYGYSLIDRSGPVPFATEAGQKVMEKAEKMLALEKELLRDLQSTERSSGITFCCTPAFGIAYLPSIMKKFMLLHSDISQLNFSFELPDKVVDGLQQGIYQLGVIEHIERLDLSGLDTFALPEDKLVFVSSPDLNLAEGEVTVDQLIRYDLYLRNEGCNSSRLLATNLMKIGRNCSDFSRKILCDDLHLIISTVCEGNGIAFISRSLVDQHLKSGILKEHRITGFDHTLSRTLIVNNSLPSNPLWADFITSIIDAFVMLMPIRG